ncbi:MAG TPA: DUF971 domain-containing protein [Ignavibacteria bacterium]|nr:DUF971 domain-containing protein [Ignavibacteria bacterium]
MENTYPTQIKRQENKTLRIQWNDGKVSEISFTKLRDECPCVHCKGESVIFDSYIPIKTPFKAAGYYDIEKIEVMGNYAIGIKWKDGHDTGIYTWDILRAISN